MILKVVVSLLCCVVGTLAAGTVVISSEPSEVDSSTSHVNISCQASGFTSLSGIVIEKEVQPGEWNVLAEAGAKSGTDIVASYVTASGTLSGPDGVFQVTVPSGAALGSYKCLAFGIDASGKYESGAAEISVSPGTGGCCEAVLDLQLKVDTLEQVVIKGEGGSGSSGSGGSSSGSGGSLSWDTSALAQINGEDLFRLLIWPKGLYSLLQPETGCPHQGFSYVEWHDNGYRQFHTESTSPENHDEVSPGNHLKQPIQNKNGDKNFMYLYFCTDLSGAEKGPDWPKGSYCIMKRAVCPTGFHEGSILWDEENFHHDNKWGGHIPDAGFGADSRIYFCCRRDADAEQAVILPTARPFYLFRFMGTCQQVAGMRVTNEYLVFDTEDSGNNIDKFFGDYHPDGELNNVRLELCYYERDV